MSASIGTSFKPPENAATIYEPVVDRLTQVTDSIRAIVLPDTEWLAETIMHSLYSQGKMLRPLIALLTSGASGACDERHVEMAAVAELIHVATLLHDDVLDKSDLRRGRPTIRAKWGNKVSILSGDYLLAQASLKLSRLNSCRLVGIFSTVLSHLCEGEVEQIRTSYSLDVNWDSYFRKSICKTATLFAACGESAGVLNENNEEQVQKLSLFGEKFGIAFQIIDDLLDYTSDAQKMGKPVMDDLTHGILTAPVLLALDNAEKNSNTHRELKRLVELLFEGQNEATASELKALLESLGSFEKTKALALSYANQARECLEPFKPSIYKDALIELVTMSIDRKL